MQAFHNDENIKQKYLNRVISHREADNIIQGTGWENGKGCAIGCTLEKYDHKQFEIELGLPQWFARLEDNIFEGLPNDLAKLWPERVLKSIKVGVNVDQIKIPFLIFVLESALEKFDHEKFPAQKKATVDIINYLKTGKENKDKRLKLRSGAYTAYTAAYAYAAAAADAAAAAYVAADYGAADAVDYAASASDAASDAAYARKNEYIKFSDKLIELLEGLE